MDPGSVPAELKGLSQTEEMLIARCCPIMRVIHLKGGQLGYGGHVVNVAQDITTFAATLPRLAEVCSRCTTKSIAKKSTTGSLPPAVPLAITPTFRPWTYTSDDSYIYQLSLVVSTATVSFINTQVYTKYRSRVFYVLSL